jgi:lipid-A-disaccharide synthase
VNPKQFMLIAGEASGDLLAAELVSALREKIPSSTLNPPSSPVFFGAGGLRMAAAGVELAFDMTQHSVIGISDVLKNYFEFRRLFNQLLKLAIERKPDAIIGVDYGGFNLRFGHAIKQYIRKNQPASTPWNPKIIQFVSPQVWASRPGRANMLAEDYDLLLSIFPFEKDWYAKRVPNLRVEFVGHPMVDRSPKSIVQSPKSENAAPTVLLLPGSRKSELQRHLPPMLGALGLIQAKLPEVRAKMVLPNLELKKELVKSMIPISKELARSGRKIGLNSIPSAPESSPSNIEFQIGNLPQALMQADIAIASTGTVTMECAFFGVPTVTLYKTSWLTYQIAKRIVTVKSLTMPNILADEEVYPEFVQDTATAENIAGAALELLQNEPRRAQIKKRLAEVVSSLGGPGATTRAAMAILSLFV